MQCTTNYQIVFILALFQYFMIRVNTCCFDSYTSKFHNNRIYVAILSKRLKLSPKIAMDGQTDKPLKKPTLDKISSRIKSFTISHGGLEIARLV